MHELIINVLIYNRINYFGYEIEPMNLRHERD